VQLHVFNVPFAMNIETAFRNARNERDGAALGLTNAALFSQRTQVAETALKSRLPLIYTSHEWAEAGALMSYGTNSADLYRRVATYVDKILKGAKAADIPVEQPTKFEFIINLKTAKQIGLTIPPNVLVRADKVIK
jgi:putative tryptophan/tyrosine transport system substrate-binding protein